MDQTKKKKTTKTKKKNDVSTKGGCQKGANKSVKNLGVVCMINHVFGHLKSQIFKRRRVFFGNGGVLAARSLGCSSFCC